jgi:hypothetical protein
MNVAITVGAVIMAAVCALLAWQTRRDARRRSAARVAALAAHIDPQPDDAAGTIFAVREAGSGPSLARLALGAGTLAAVVLVSVLAAAVMRSQSAPEARTPEAPLALIALEHSGRPGRLVVSGQVRTQRAGATAPILVSVTAVGRAGDVLGTRQAVVSQGPLTPGQAVPFAVSLAGIGGVERYRVAFRDATQVVRHVDRRQAPAAL